jgi:phosphate uptake regulator
MDKINDFLAKHGTLIIIALLLLVYMKSCSTNSDVDRVKKEVRAIDTKVTDLETSLFEECLNQEEMVEIIKETPAWKTLRIEEISDKERISINALEEKEQ